MGALCCRPCGEEFEEYVRPNSSIQTPCICLRYFFHRLFTGSAMYQRFDGSAITSQVQTGTPLASTGPGTASADNSLSETFQLIPRPAPYDTDPRYSRLQRDGLISRRDKSTPYVPDDPQALRRSTSSSGTEHLGVGKKWNGAVAEEDHKSNRSELEKTLSVKASYAVDYKLTSEDEDICPTCLDEYTPENPKILMRCSHHFHLGCIYEWMERSDNCPLCGEEMEFSESPCA